MIQRCYRECRKITDTRREAGCSNPTPRTPVGYSLVLTRKAYTISDWLPPDVLNPHFLCVGRVSVTVSKARFKGLELTIFRQLHKLMLSKNVVSHSILMKSSNRKISSSLKFCMCSTSPVLALSKCGSFPTTGSSLLILKAA